MAVHHENRPAAFITVERSTGHPINPTTFTFMSLSTPNEQFLGVESLVINNDLHEGRWGLWHKLGDNEPLGRLHSQFWRTSMVNEEKEWLRKQKTDLSASVNGSDDSDRMRLDVDGDIGPGCYVLDIDDGFRRKKVWIRSEYIRLYDQCTNHYNRCLGKRALSLVNLASVSSFFRFVSLIYLTDMTILEKGSLCGSITLYVDTFLRVNQRCGTVVEITTCL